MDGYEKTFSRISNVWRKYDSSSLRTEYYNEVGIRILLGYIIRNGLKYNFSFTPLFSHCTRHYFRIYLKGVKSLPVSKDLKYFETLFLYLVINGSNEIKITLTIDDDETNQIVETLVAPMIMTVTPLRTDVPTCFP